MNRDEALDLAEEKWGDDALVLEIAPGHYAVGTFFGRSREVYGSGESYLAAFSNASTKGH